MNFGQIEIVQEVQEVFLMFFRDVFRGQDAEIESLILTVSVIKNALFELCI